MKSRLRYSVINSTVSAGSYLLKILLSFFLRTYFIHLLGVNILGLNGLFTNILSFLSLAELGIGTSIVYELYQPIATGDKESVKSLMKLYKKAYEFIGVMIAIIGTLVAIFLPLMIKDGNVTTQVYLYYFLFLANSVVSYFFTYKRSLLNANQMYYKTIINDFIFYIVGALLQLVVLVQFQSYIGYLLIQIGVTLFSNISISYIVNKAYPFLSEKNVKKVDATVLQELKKNIVGNISSQIGSVVVLGSDNILLSSFVGLSVVGIYSNYTMITNAVKGVMQQVTGSIIPSVGNLIVSENSKRIIEFFGTYLFINSSISFVSGVSLYALINNFVKLWVGSSFVLSNFTVVLIAVYLTVLMYQGAVRTFISGYGLFWKQRWKPIFEACTNLLLSILFLLEFKLGINGVLLATIFSSILVVMWYEPYLLFKYGFKASVFDYFKTTIIFYLKFGLSIIIVQLSTNVINTLFTVTNFIEFIKFSTIQLLVVFTLYILLFGFNFRMRRLISIIKERMKK